MATSRLKRGGMITAAGALAVSLVGGYEGMRTHAYRDVVGVPTVCFGETRGVHMGDKYTPEQCKAMLGDGLVSFEAPMRRCLDNPDGLPAKVYVSFLSLSYNIGAGAFCRSSIAAKANAGDLRGACDALMLYDRAGGHVVAGLKNRREDERKICLEGVGEGQ